MLPLNLGGISLALQVVILFLLVLGLPFVRGVSGRKNLSIHGYVTVSAVVLHTILIFVVMIPSALTDFASLSNLSIPDQILAMAHAVLASITEALAIAVIGIWLLKSPSKMACFRYRKWMIPLFIIWTLSVVTGAIGYFFGIL
jgi:hypothetical protein